MTMPILAIRRLSKAYRGADVLKDVSLTLDKGDIYGLMGKNGAGKTTLIRTIASMALPDSGDIELFGKNDPAGLNAGRHRMGAIIEEASFYPYLSARKNLEFYRTARGIPGTACIDEALNLVGLGDTGKKKFKHFSLGMKQRLGLALAIMHKPDFLILDEPTNGLDPVGIVEFRNILLKLNAERDVTIFISSHILSELSNVATRYGFLHNGRLVHEVTATELCERCRTYLELVVDDPARAVVVMEGMLHQKAYDVLPDGHIRIYGLFDDVPRLTQALASQSVGIRSLSPMGDSLEDYFLSIIGGEDHA